MNRKYIDWAKDASVVILALTIILSFFQSGGKAVLGNTWAGGTSHTNSLFDAVGGFAVNGTTVITSSTAFVATSITNSGSLSTAGLTNSGSMTVGGGTTITKDVCATSSVAIGSLAANATTTFDVAIAGATTSANQAYFAGVATTTAQSLRLSANPTSTTGFVTVLAQNLNTAAFSAAPVVVSVCYRQF